MEVYFQFSKHSWNFYKFNNFDFVLVWQFGMIEKSPDSELYPPKRSARSAGTHSQTGSTNPTPPNWFPNFPKDPYSVFGPQMPLVPPNSTLPLHIPTGIGWKAYQWTMHLDLKRLGNHCKGCSCTKNQHDAIQHYVKAATSKNFKFGIFELKF